MADETESFSLSILFWITILNYLAQIPYYLHNYYFPYHVLPTASSVILLGLTLAWFLIGYIAAEKGSYLGYLALCSFLVVEALFYAHAVLFGAVKFQMQNPSLVIKAVFLIGYLSGITAGHFAYRLIRRGRI